LHQSQHLKYLRAIEFVIRKPDKGGQGRRGKYYFRTPAIPKTASDFKKFLKNKKSVEFVGFIDSYDELVALRDFINRPAKNPDGLAVKFMCLYQAYGICLADLLERTTYLMSKEVTKEQFFYSELMKIDMKIGSAVLSLLDSYPKMKSEATQIFYNRIKVIPEE